MNKYFLYVGNAYPHKNLERLFEAVKFLNQSRDQKVMLKIVSAKNEFIRRLEKYKNQYVELLGFVSKGQLNSLYNRSVAFVFPSLSEGFGLPGIEAMEAGTLVLASDIPVFREIYKDSVTYFNPHDFSSIAKAMQNTLELTNDQRNTIIEKSKKFVSQYSWEKMAKNTLKIYENV